MIRPDRTRAGPGAEVGAGGNSAPLGPDTLLARIGAIRHAIEARDRAKRQAVTRLVGETANRNSRGEIPVIPRFAGGVDRLELSYPAGDPLPVIEIRADPGANLTRIFADGHCVVVLAGADALEQTDIRLTRDIEARRGRQA
ncbi:hypothetical protein [Pseudooceanicola algae]|nr:hypothetical protein [Pseudooceanicola algae]